MVLDPRTLAEAAAHRGQVNPEKAAESMALATRMAALKDRMDTGMALLKELTHEYDQIRKNLLPEAMNAAGLVAASGRGSFTLADGRKVHLQGDLNAYVAAGQQEVFHAWLRQNGHGDLIKETVHHSTLKAFAKEQLSEHVPLPDCLQAAPYLKAVLRRA